MCLNPGKLVNGQMIACRKCWQCRERRINDWVGRCIAENKTAKASNFVSLTYGRDPVYGSIDHERAAVLTYSDVQKYIKRVRRAGFPLRYFAVGEYGTLKGRAHWHILMFWQEQAPERVLDERISCPWWDHGFAQYENMTSRSIRYCCKYLQKDVGEMSRQGHLAMSKKPPIGNAYFHRLAKQYVEQYLAPQTLGYSWPDQFDRNGKPVRFMMGNKTAENFLEAYVTQWKAAHPEMHMPNSELVEEYLDKIAKQEIEFSMPERIFAKAVHPWAAAPNGGETVWNEKKNVFEARGENGVLYWTQTSEGNRSWTETIKSVEESAETEKKARLLPRPGREYREKYSQKSRGD